MKIPDLEETEKQNNNNNIKAKQQQQQQQQQQQRKSKTTTTTEKQEKRKETRHRVIHSFAKNMNEYFFNRNILLGASVAKKVLQRK